MAGARIAHVVPTDRIAYLLLRSRLTRLRDAGYEVSVLCGRAVPPTVESTDALPDDLGQALEAEGLRVRYLPFARELAPLTDARCAAALYREIRRERYDILHSHNPKGGLLVPPVARMARTSRVLHTVHGLLFHDTTPQPLRALAVAAERWTASWCHHLLFQSREDYELAVRNDFKEESRLHLVGNGIDENRFDRQKHAGSRRRTRDELGFGDDHLVVGMVGRLVREKGFVEFFEMAGLLAQWRPQTRFLVVGIPEMEEQSDAVDPHALARHHGVTDLSQVLVMRPDMPELYSAMDVAVLPSHREGIPRAILEAAAMGVAVVASDIRGCREVVQAGRTGLLAPVRNGAAFASAVETLVVNDQLRRQFAEAGRERVLTEYTESLVAQRLTACYESILSSSHSC